MSTLVMTEAEFTAIEYLLAKLLAAADSSTEETRILALHARVTVLFEQGASLRAARDRLAAVKRATNAHTGHNPTQENLSGSRRGR